MGHRAVSLRNTPNSHTSSNHPGVQNRQRNLTKFEGGWGRVYHDKSNDNNHGIGRGEEWDYSEDKVVMRHLICGKSCVSHPV